MKVRRQGMGLASRRVMLCSSTLTAGPLVRRRGAGARGGRGAGENVVDLGPALHAGGDGLREAAVGGRVTGVVGRGDEVAGPPHQRGHFSGGHLEGGLGTVGLFEHIGEGAGLALVLVQGAGAG
jgi:hypothetical protein